MMARSAAAARFIENASYAREPFSNIRFE